MSPYYRCLHQSTDLNSRSLRNKLPEFYSLLEGTLSNICYDILIVTETWLNSSITDNIILNCSNKYHILRKDRLVSTGGDICIVYKSKYKCTNTAISIKFAHFEYYVWIWYIKK